MNGITAYILATLMAAMLLGSYAFTWSIFGNLESKLARIEARVNAIYDILRK